MSCENCENWKRSYRHLERELSDLKDELQAERKKTESVNSITRERDELRSRANRSYDDWATDPERGRRD